MNQQCKVCGEPAAGFHFGAFTCEGCKSFFGRTYNNLSSISECKNNGECIINKKNRTACKACRLRKCLSVGMSKSGSRYGRRSNWFKIHCLLQEQQQQHIQHMQDGKTPPVFNPSQMNSPFLPANLLPAAALAGYYKNSNDKSTNLNDEMRRQSISPSDSGASSADPEDDSSRSTSALSFFKAASSPLSEKDFHSAIARNSKENRKRKHSSHVQISLALPPSPFGSSSSVASFSPSGPFFNHSAVSTLRPIPSGLLTDTWHARNGGDLEVLCSPAVTGIAIEQDQPMDLSIKSTVLCRSSSKVEECSDSEPELSIDLNDDENTDAMKSPLDLTLVSKRVSEVPMTG